MSVLTYPEAIGVGLLQGVTELFPVSSLGHSILVPALIGGSWKRDLSVSSPGSPYMNVLIGLHLATALALVVYFWRDWVRVIGGLFSSLRERRIETVDQRLAWLLIVATVPVGIVGLVLDKLFQNALYTPTVAAVFLTLNGGVLYVAERMKRGGSGRRRAGDAAVEQTDADGRPLDADQLSDRRITGKLGWKQATVVGGAQILALLPGISRSGVTMSTGIFKGLRHEDSARFAFLLATPVILAAGVLKIPDLTGPLGNGIHGQILVGSVLSGVGAYVSVRFLVKYFQTRTLTPFAIYCVLFGAASIIYLSVK